MITVKVRLLTTREAERITGIHIRTIQRACKSGSLTSQRRDDGRYVISREDLEQFQTQRPSH